MTLRPALALALLASSPALAAGDLLVAPTRVVLDGQRGTEVILNNVGQEIATYRVSLELRRMTRDGRLEDVTSETANPHEVQTLAMISYAPRRVTLPPNQPQAIRIGVRAPEGLADGEYRAHLLFRAIPDAEPADAAAKDAKGVTVALRPIYGVSIPIIVRQGQLKATAALSNPRRCGQDAQGRETAFGTKDSLPSLCVTLAKQGGRSTYGRIRFVRDGKALVDARGVALYAELGERTVALPLDPTYTGSLPGPVTVEYLDDSDGGTLARVDGVIR